MLMEDDLKGVRERERERACGEDIKELWENHFEELLNTEYSIRIELKLGF